MLGLDDRLVDLGAGAGVWLALLVALLLGLRHATDPDHLTAIATLTFSDRTGAGRRAGIIGLAWGAGHGCTMLAVGLPLVLIGAGMPAVVQSVLELAVAALIVALALRLLLRWRRGELHSHSHRHGAVVHAHPHVHEHAPGRAHGHVHRHAHQASLGRTPVASFGIGLVHGAGGSAGAAILLLATLPGQAAAATGLAVLALGTALAMASVTALFGAALARGAGQARVAALAPGFGTASLAFGVWYGLAAVGALPYAL